MRWTLAAMAGLICIGAVAPAAKPVAAAMPLGFVMTGDTLVHEASGTAFPLRVAGFTRTDERSFDPAGQDVSITYRQKIGGKPVVARIALIQIVAMTPQEHYLGMKGVVGSYFGDLLFDGITLESEAPFDPPGMAPGSGYQGRFRATQAGTPYELSLSTMKLAAWDARLTAAYPAAAQDKARANIGALAAALLKTGPGAGK